MTEMFSFANPFYFIMWLYGSLQIMTYLVLSADLDAYGVL